MTITQVLLVHVLTPSLLAWGLWKLGMWIHG